MRLSSTIRGLVCYLVFCAAFLQLYVLKGSEVKNDQDGLKAQLLNVYKSDGEAGVRNFYSLNREKISDKFIYDWASTKASMTGGRSLDIALILAKCRKNKLLEADILTYFMDLLRVERNIDKVIKYYERVYPVYVESKDPYRLGRLNWLIAQFYVEIGELAKARIHLDQSMYFLKDVNHPLLIGNVYLCYGRIMYMKGKNKGALSFFDKAISYLEITGEPGNICAAYLKKGDVHAFLGEVDEALRCYDKALGLAKSANNLDLQSNILVAKGNMFFYSSEYETALGYFKSAEKLLDKTKNLIARGNLSLGIGDIYFNIGENARALASYDRALELFRQAKEPIGIGLILKKKGDLLFYSGKSEQASVLYDEAMVYFKRIGDPSNIGNLLRTKGTMSVMECDYQNALIKFDEAQEYYIQSKDVLGLGNVCFHRADVFLRMGKTLDSLKQLSEAISYYSRANSTANLVNAYYLKGEAYFRIGDYQKANEMYDKALDFVEQAGQKSGEPNILIRKASIYKLSGSIGKAEKLLNKALKLSQKQDDPISQANALFLMGEIHMKDGKEDAEDLFKKAFACYKKVGDFIGRGNVYLTRGDLKMLENNYNRAIELYDQAFRIYDQIDSLASCALSLFKKANVYVKLGERRSALSCYEDAFKYVENVRFNSGVLNMKRSLWEMFYPEFNKALSFMYAKKFYKKGFRCLELVKARNFFDQLTEGLVNLEKGFEPSLKENRETVVSEIAGFQKRLFESNSKEEIDLFKARIASLELKLKDIQEQVRLNNPLYSSVEYLEPSTIDILRRNILLKDEVLLHYFMSAKEIFVFIISRERFKVVKLDEAENNIIGRSREYLKKVINGDKNLTFNQASHILYRKIFQPLEKYLKKAKNLIIVPDRELALVPFESFVVKRPGIGGQPVFLVEQYRIKYIQSASVLGILRNHYQRKRETNRFIGFGDPVYDYENFSLGKPEKGSKIVSRGNEIEDILRSRYLYRGGKRNRLEATGNEVRAIAEIFKGLEEGRCMVRLRENALEEVVKSEAMKNYDYIHFACHGLLAEGFQSLVLSQDIPKHSDDGYLTLNEAMNCDFNAKLVVLSACQTGDGKLEKGEGVTGLTHAVMYAGTPAVVASLWKVDDTATKELMIHFYENLLKRKMSKAEALRQAKISLLNSDKYSSPRHWSAFVMYGE